MMSRQQHEQHLELVKLVRKHTMAATGTSVIGWVPLFRWPSSGDYEDGSDVCRVAESGVLGTRQTSHGDSIPSPPVSVPTTP
ncbi:hypothetical protein Pst134EA_031324, partial [Puccinia striiformis f. sp. tritici]|uniref:uncharacterized protein n=1 Tax=Puccinia striiformis f. sp. tritici TaxID=168172 RepID=UPI00200785C5